MLHNKNKIALLGTASLGLLSLGFLLGYLAAPNPATNAPLRATGPSSGKVQLAGETATATVSLAATTSLQALPAAQQLINPANEQTLCAQLQQLASTDPRRALALAATATTPRQRELFRNAALQGWATRDSRAAAIWTLANVRSEERRAAVEALASGAIVQPEQAASTFNYLVGADPLQASDHGNSLVYAFAKAGQYDLASNFAATGPSEFRASWLCTVYNQWATYQPAEAVASLDKIADAAARTEALAGLFAGWSMSDPATLVAYAQTLPKGDTRLQALNDGLSQWVHRDPAAASAWMDKFDPSPDLDAGAAAVAVAPALIAKKPDIAASWAESITDPELRANTLLDLIRLWAERDPAAARHYAATTQALPADRRELALSSLQPAP